MSTEPKSKKQKATKQPTASDVVAPPAAIVSQHYMEVDPETRANAVFEAHPGFQTEYLMSMEREVFSGGGRGGGKSYVMLAVPLRFVDKPRFRGLVVRKTMKQLRDLIRKAKHLYTFAGAVWKEQDKMFVFPSGAVIEFNYLETADDYDQYHGQEYDFIGVDEGTEYKDIDDIIRKLRTCLRGGDSTIPKMIRITGNPGGPGIRAIRDRYVSQSLPGVPFLVEQEINGIKVSEYRKWFHSTVDDNPTESAYKRELLLAVGDNENLKRQWIDGDFNAVDGLAFDEFRIKTHVCEPFSIPRGWYRIQAADWGFSTMAVCLWLAIDYDGNVFVYRELTSSKQTADIFQQQINKANSKTGEKANIEVLDGSAFQMHGGMTKSPGDTMIEHGGRWTPADRSSGSRAAGKMLIHNYLAIDPATGEPKMKIFSNCEELIKELSNLQLDPSDPEDISRSRKESQPDHAYDALRYGLSSIWSSSKRSADFANVSAESTGPVIVDRIFGY